MVVVVTVVLHMLGIIDIDEVFSSVFSLVGIGCGVIFLLIIVAILIAIFS